MIEYTKEVLNEELENKENEHMALVKEKYDIENLLKEINKVKFLKSIIKVLAIMFVASYLSLGIIGAISGSLELTIICGYAISFMLPVVFGVAVPTFIDCKKHPDIVKLSNKELNELSDELISKKKELNDLIFEIANVINEYEAAIELYDVKEELQVDCDIKNVKTEDEYIDVCEKQEFFKNEWDKFVDEPIDYQDIHLEVDDVMDVKIKRLGSR